MKKNFILLVLLIVCLSCGTNNKPVSEAQKEKIIGEVKEVVNSIIDAAEKANPDLIFGTWFDSPDFVFTYNGSIFNYQQSVEMAKAVFGTLINQDGTIVEEKFVVLNNFTVLYTANSKFLVNLKDGSSILQEPWVMQYVFKKINNEWKVVSANESGVEKSVAGETAKSLNQIELMGQFKGIWQSQIGKDTIEYWDCQEYGKSFTANVYQVIKGQKKPLYVNNISFVSKAGTFKGFTLWSDGGYGTWIGGFMSEKVLSGNFVWDLHSTMPWGKYQIEFISPQEFTWKYFNKEGVKTGEMAFNRVR